MDDTAVLLARVQFALTIMFHYIYPPLSIGLGVVLVAIESRWLVTGDPAWKQAARFWTRVFALTFAIGVATGLVMEFEFGTNWATYSRFVGDVFGSALAAEGIFAFFLESGFLAILLFGWDRVPKWLHFTATCLVCFGAHFSAVWIVVANSWMQTPAGYHIVQGPLGVRAEITDFWAMVFNPSSMHRLSHTLLGAWMAGAFLVCSISAWYLLKGRHLEFARRSLKVGLGLAVIASCLQLVTGHISADGVAKNQPVKLAAMEGHWTTGPADLSLAGWVDAGNGRTHALAIPGGLSLLVHHDPAAVIPGLDSVPAADRPPVQLTFQAYHGMIAIGTALIALSLVASFLAWRGRLASNRPLLWCLVFSVLGPQIANQLGWITAEVGRQPWIVYGLLRTRDAASRTVSSGDVIASMALFGTIYIGLFAVFVYLLNDKIAHGPEDIAHEGPIYTLKGREA